MHFDDTHKDKGSTVISLINPLNNESQKICSVYNGLKTGLTGWNSGFSSMLKSSLGNGNMDESTAHFIFKDTSPLIKDQ